MRCSICKKEIFYNIKFKDLFEFNFVCKECSKLLKPKMTVIPIDNGHIIKYYYFLLKDEYKGRIDTKINNEIINIIKGRRKETVYFLDDNIKEMFKFLNFNNNVILISKVYVELENLLDENEL